MNRSITDTLGVLLEGGSLSTENARSLMASFTAGEATEAQIAAALTAIRVRGETAEEIRGFAMAMRNAAIDPAIPDTNGAVDIVGTGGDGAGTYNISTAAAIVTCAAGVPVVKHGNRSVSSRSGSADLLERLGLDTTTTDPTQTFAETGFAFLFAPRFHPAMAHVASVRAQLAARTVMNILGPLTNPAAPPFALLGAYSLPVASLMADALSGMPIRRAFVVHGTPGWDEATPAGPFTLLDVTPGSVEQRVRNASDIGVPRCDPEDLRGGAPEENAAAMRRVCAGERSAHRDAVTLNAGLALEVAGAVGSMAAGVAAASNAIDDGRATRLLDRLGKDHARA